MNAHSLPVNDAVVLAAIIGESKILLIKENTKPIPHFFKMVSETVLAGETILSALCRGVAEEAGFHLEVRKSGDDVVEITDRRLMGYRQLKPSHIVPHPRPHRRHFWGLLTKDEVIESLSGQFLTGDENEHIETAAFDLCYLEGMVDLLPHHRKLINELRV